MTPWGKVFKLVRMRFGLPYVRRADVARDQGRWIDAIVGFRRGLEWMPWRDDLRIQIGNCLKEFGDYEGAAEVYTTVSRLPTLYDSQTQLDDLDLRAGRSVLRYRVADSAGVPVPTQDPDGSTIALSARLFPNRVKQGYADPRHWLGPLGQVNAPPVRRRSNGYATIKFDQIGALSLEQAGVREPIFTGIVAVRGRVATMRRISSIAFRLGEGATRIELAPATVREVPMAGPLKLYVFNAWLDCATMPPGRHWFEASVEGTAPAGTFVHVGAVADLSNEFRSSNGYVPSASGVSAEQAVLSLPAEARPAQRSLFDQRIQTILVMRVDQLGDVSASLPAFARLRALFPNARITALVQHATAAIIAASGVADEVLTLRLDYDTVTERRRLSIDEELRLREELSLHHFDLAIDLCPGHETRPLLLLANAVYLVGFAPERFGFLDFGIALRSRDKVNQLEKVPHAVMVLSLVEAFAAAMVPERDSVPRMLPIREATFTDRGLVPKAYVVLHAGARHALNEWPLERFVELAVSIARDTPFRVVMFLNPGSSIDPLPADVADRVVKAGVLDPDLFDEIISHAALVVGNDSGPKHLAAARGVPTVSVQVGRLNWNEWGQDSRGVVVAKRVPCTGCGLNDIALCGRDAICVTSISTKEVLAAVRHCLTEGEAFRRSGREQSVRPS